MAEKSKGLAWREAVDLLGLPKIRTLARTPQQLSNWQHQLTYIPWRHLGPLLVSVYRERGTPPATLSTVPVEGMNMTRDEFAIIMSAMDNLRGTQRVVFESLMAMFTKLSTDAAERAERPASVRRLPGPRPPGKI